MYFCACGIEIRNFFRETSLSRVPLPCAVERGKGNIVNILLLILFYAMIFLLSVEKPKSVVLNPTIVV